MNIFTPNLRALQKYLDVIKGVEVFESSLSTEKEELVFFTGSMLDRSEIAYRATTKNVGVYVTVLDEGMRKVDVDDYWFEVGYVLVKVEVALFLYLYKQNAHKTSFSEKTYSYIVCNKSVPPEMATGDEHKKPEKNQNREKGDSMSCTLYINHRNERARLHEDDCERVRAGGGGGANGEYRYFNDYDEAWEWMEENLDGYDYGDCHYCNPDNG